MTIDHTDYEEDWRGNREYRSECDCCGKMKYGCRDVYVSYAGDTHACPECLGDAYGEYEYEDRLA